ncbi:hypothetical protein ACWCV5_01335 [Streptomyces tubercidicus]
MTNSLAKQLRDLRVRAGNPPFRELERLLEGQGRNRSMARSTIQEKLSGKSPAKLHQILALVSAIAEYGNKNGTPLTPQEVDENTWRAKFVAASGKRRSITPNGDAAASPESTHSPAMWDATPLRNAGMTDLLDLLSQSEGTPLASWLPHVASEMRRAQMSCESLMKWAAQASPQEVVHCIAAIEEIFPLPENDPNDPWTGWSPDNDATAGYLLRHAARLQTLRNIPITVVGLRRANVGNYVEPFLTNVACWHLATSLRSAVSGLKSAELTADALKMLEYVGSERQEARVMEVVTHFHEHGETKERDAILKGMASRENRFMTGISASKNEEMQNVLISAIPWSKRSDYAELLSNAGFKQLAAKITPAYSDEPPF